MSVKNEDVAPTFYTLLYTQVMWWHVVCPGLRHSSIYVVVAGINHRQLKSILVIGPQL